MIDASCSVRVISNQLTIKSFFKITLLIFPVIAFFILAIAVDKDLSYQYQSLHSNAISNSYSLFNANILSY